MRSPIETRYEDLPQELPIFPLSGALLLPHGRLPLNIFEPRYLAMVDAALKGQRMIGMVQPDPDHDTGARVPVIAISGLAGNISAEERESLLQELQVAELLQKPFPHSDLLDAMHRALAKEAGCTLPLHRCSIYESAAAGKKLNAVTNSRVWMGTE